MSTHRRHLREAVEIVGVISIVASVLLVAWEVRPVESDCQNRNRVETG
jgi:hypothetical protein